MFARPDDSIIEAAAAGRAVSPEDTVARLRPHFGRLGITRLSRQTDLDRIGVPCWACFRPNAASLSVTQGKGLTDAAAQASAVMEAVEYAVAEDLDLPVVYGSSAELGHAGHAFHLPDRFLPEGAGLREDQLINWVVGNHLETGPSVLVPRDLVNLDAAVTDLRGICKSSNGLASGNTRSEAVLHGLCELIERDAITMWGLLPDERQLACAIEIEAQQDPAVRMLVQSVRRAGLDLSVFDITTDVGIPCVAAVVGPPRQASGGEPFAICAGYACHPVPAFAVAKAILEATQSRITAIAAARDDIASESFDALTSSWDLELLEARPAFEMTGGASWKEPNTWLRWTQDRLTDCRVNATVVDLGGSNYGAAVVKVLSEDLEDRESNPNWRPGWRALAQLGAI